MTIQRKSRKTLEQHEAQGRLGLDVLRGMKSAIKHKEMRRSEPLKNPRFSVLHTLSKAAKRFD
jgi:hypothetical protein